MHHNSGRGSFWAIWVIAEQQARPLGGGEVSRAQRMLLLFAMVVGGGVPFRFTGRKGARVWEGEFLQGLNGFLRRLSLASGWVHPSKGASAPTTLGMSVVTVVDAKRRYCPGNGFKI